MIYYYFQVLKKFGVEKYDPINEHFDPNRHNAVFQVPDSSKPSGTVAAVLKVSSLLFFNAWVQTEFIDYIIILQILWKFLYSWCLPLFSNSKIDGWRLWIREYKSLYNYYFSLKLIFSMRFNVYSLLFWLRACFISST